MAQDTCAICLEPLIQHGSSDENMEAIGAAMCGHCFHCDCFWRWEQAKSSQNWRSMRYNAACPCPVCNQPVMEFIRLYITGDKSENERLKKELKNAKKKLAKERVRLQRAQDELKAATGARERTSSTIDRSISAPRSRRTFVPSNPFACGGEENDDIQALCDTVRLLLAMPSSPTPNRTITNAAAPRSYRPYESCPTVDYGTTVVSASSTDPVVPSTDRISLPPPPTSQVRSSRTLRSAPAGSGRDATSRGDAPSAGSVSATRSRAPPPRPDPTEADRRLRNARPSSPPLSELLWFPEFEPPSCRSSIDADGRSSARGSLITGGSSSRSDPPPLQN